MTLQVTEIETGTAPSATIIFMHGLGADRSDFVPFAQQLDLSGVGHVRYLFPGAPVIPVAINGGYPMPAWYDILASDLVRREDEAGLRQSQAAIEQIIAREKERGIPARRIVIGGFSQGCAMALMVGLRHAEPLAGIVGLSGYLPLAAVTAAERHATSHDTPIFLAHGTQDPVVPHARAVASRDALTEMGYTVEWHQYPMLHTVTLQEIADLQAWLQRVLRQR